MAIINFCSAAVHDLIDLLILLKILVQMNITKSKKRKESYY